MGPSLNVHLLGGFRLEHQGEPVVFLTNSARLHSIFAYLILQRDKPASRQQLAALFWPKTSEAQARTNLRNLIHQLRQSFPYFDEFIYSDTQTLGWRMDSSFSLDVSEFEACLALKPGVPLPREMLSRAVRLYTGDLLPDCYDDWIAPIRERLRTAYLSTLEALAALAEDRREYASALEYAGQLAAEDPLRASANHRLVRLNAVLGNREAAVRAYRAYARRLSKELGAEPEVEIRELVERLQHLGVRPGPAPKDISALVGRNAGWRAMLSAWQSALAGQSQLLLISGEAGIGKTRLVEELSGWAGSQGLHALTAHCYPAEGDLPYAPVVSWLKAQPLPRLEKVWLSELARLLPEVRQSYSGLGREEPIREAWQRQRLFEALVRALLARNRAQILILEDIHWCDQDTLEWLHYLLRFPSRYPLLVVATLRSGEVAPGHPVALLQSALRAENRLLEQKLLPLSEAESIELANQVCQQSWGRSLSAEEAGEVYRKSEGNPLFVVEMVRLRSSQPAPEPAGAEELAVSEQAQSILQRRVGQISAETRELTCLAATIGRKFSLEVLREASQEDDEGLVRALDELLDRQIIREVSPETPVSLAANGSKDAYDFTHDLLRQAAFGGLSGAHRRLLHRKVAEAYRRLDQESPHPRHAEIASHYELAGLSHQAIEHYRLAAGTAESMFANADAQRYLRRAITLAEGNRVGSAESIGVEAFAGCLEKLGDLLALDGKYAQAREAYERALARNDTTANVWRSQVYRKICDTGMAEFSFAPAHAALDRAERILGETATEAGPEERLEWLQVRLMRIQLYYWEGRPEMMDGIFRQVEPEIQSIGSSSQKIELLKIQAMQRLRQERYRLSAGTVEVARRRLHLARQSAGPYEQAVATYQVGFCLLWRGNLAEARTWLARAVEMNAKVGARIWQVRSLAYLNIAERKLGNLEEVQKTVPPLLELSAFINDSVYKGMGLANLGWLAYRRGDLDQAERLCSQASDFGEKFESNPFPWLANWVLLALAFARRDLPRAAGLAQTFINPRSTDQLPIKPAAERLRLALSAWQAGDEAGALGFYSQALDVARRAGEL